MSSSWMRIAVVQFAPKLGEVQANIAKARELCRGLTPRSVDLVCFPEMAFTGYMFPDAPSIAPFLEHPRTGPTGSFCAELARRLECFVVAGVPLAECPESPTAARTPPPSADPSTAHLVGTNAALLYDPSGHLVHAAHKSNLFPTDLTWARPGAGFTAVELPSPPLGRTAVGICNDVNVRAGTVWASCEAGPYELATWCVAERVRVLVLLNAWLKPEDGGMEGVGESARGVRAGGDAGDESGDAGDESGEGTEMEDGDGLEPNWEVVNYWAMRLRPLWATAAPDGTEEGSEDTRSSGAVVHASAEQQRDVIVVVCNRFGRERGKTFAGSSAMFVMRPGSGKPRLLHVMGEREEGVCVWSPRVGPSQDS